MPDGVTVYEFEAIGTGWQIEIADPLTDAARDQLLVDIMARIEDFDQAYSRFRADSLVTEMSRKAGIYELPSDAPAMFELYQRLYRATDGAMTPLIGQVLVEAGYDADYSLKPGVLHQPPQWDDIMTYQDPVLDLRKPALLDFGAAGKGYLVDIVAEVVEAAGCLSYTVDAGGDMVYKNPHGELIRVGLEHPEDPTQVIGVINLLNQSICASAGNRRAWGDYHHIMHPTALKPVRQVLAVWTTARTALIADGLATALFFTPGKTLQQEFEFEYLLIRPDYSYEQSAGFSAELVT